MLAPRIQLMRRRAARLGVAMFLIFGTAFATADVITFTTPVTINAGDTTYDGHDIVVNGTTVTIDGHHEFASLHITNSGVVTHSSNTDTKVNTLDLTIAGILTVDAGSSINVAGKGYSCANGPGAGGTGSTYGAGAAHGGNGGNSSQATGGTGYDSPVAPTDLGSGGGRGDPYIIGGAGGGAVQLEVTGVITIEGTINANGNNGIVQGGNYGGGGAGGSVYITAGTINGAGTVSAIGGNSAGSNSGGGGGGRIALIANNNNFQGTTQIYGGTGYVIGGAGTAYFKVTGDGVLVIDNNDQNGAWTRLGTPIPFDLVLRHFAIVYPIEALTVGDLHVSSSAVLTHIRGGLAIDMTILGDATIDADASISVNSRGYNAAEGPGAGADGSTYGGGGAYGGAGGNSNEATGGGVYGSITTPTDFGSGGGNGEPYDIGGYGGGALRLDIAGLLTLEGRISADGAEGRVTSGNYGGGGAGGSILISIGTFAGNGQLQANGGGVLHANCGAGAGGRIAVYYDANAFAGAITAYGGTGYRNGGAGTIYTKAAADARGDLFIDNNGNSGGWTDLLEPIPDFDVIEIAGAGYLAPAPMSIVHANTLNIRATGYLRHRPNDNGGIYINVSGDVLVEVDGQVNVDACGYGPRTGPGAGGNTTNSGAGGGYGGPGGYGSDALGGGTYGSTIEPVDLGSGGGEETDGSGSAGRGGGAIRFSIGGTLRLDGTISANGGAGNATSTSWDHGGGSGGSIWINADSITGTGAINAIGGDRSIGANGGGGGGGRIALYKNTNAFTGTINACAGTGYHNGGAGTIYILAADAIGSALILDNSGIAGGETDLPDVSTIDNNLIVRNAAILSQPGELAVNGDVTVEADGLITHPVVAEGTHYTITGDLTIEAGGRFSIDARGFAPRSGPGAGASTANSGGGGGYGGPGGHGSDAAGGITYGSVVEPVDLGSGGGEETDASANAGHGGGAVQLSIDGMLTVDGILSANGGAGTGTSSGDHAGGSGGSLWIEAGTLTGAGAITANGGNGGAGVDGGGGGGGRIAVYLENNAYAGTITACGGAGDQVGGAGTIYIDSADGIGSALILDNCGITGAETNLPDVSTIENKLSVSNKAILTHSGELSVAGHVTVAADGVITHAAGAPGLYLVAGDGLTVEENGRIDMTNRGYVWRSGPGAGASTPNSGGGGGYGGTGGNGFDAAGGGTYGDSMKPFVLGSGGGEETDAGNHAGRGGGAVALVVSGTLTVDGTIRSLGGDSTGLTSGDHGGGSGGSIYIKTDALLGAGTISVDGGTNGAASNGGGGGGGRIAIYTCDMQMSTSLITANGGAGYQNGQAGTIEYGSSTVVITAQPQTQVLHFGDPATLTVIATGDGELSYQWRKDGVPLENDGHYSGVETDTLSIDVFAAGDVAAYDVIITDNCGPFASDYAILTIPPDLDRDGDVDLSDLAQLLAHYGQTGVSPEDGDLDGDGDVDISDLAELLGRYGIGV